MSVEFTNAYQEVLLENLQSILKQNFMFQTQLKIVEQEANNKAELQARVENLTLQLNECQSKVGKTEQYKLRAEQSDNISDEKTRIQTALNDSMKKVASLTSSLEATEKELLGLKEYVAKLESIAPATKLKKINTVKVEEPKPDDSAPNDLFQIKVDDGSSF